MRVELGLLWLLLMFEAFALSPPVREDVWPWIADLLAMRWANTDLSVVALFNLMGLWPLVIGAQLADRLFTRPVPLILGVVGSMFLGAFWLLPLLMVASDEREALTPLGRFLRHPWLMVGVAAVGSSMFLVAFTLGRPPAFLDAWMTDGFVHIMTADFVILWITSILLARQNTILNGPPWWAALVPIVGIAAAEVVHEREEGPRGLH